MAKLTHYQVRQITKLLRERERILREEIREGLLRAGGERYRDLAGVVTDAGDESVADMLVDIGIASIGRDVNELRGVESALARADRPDFGDCADCGESIGYERLEANPSASRCRSCQADRERGYAHEETPSL